jgi:FtsP/CotA-like multicopper oxidase with cupredoxin domain
VYIHPIVRKTRRIVVLAGLGVLALAIAVAHQTVPHQGIHDALTGNDASAAGTHTDHAGSGNAGGGSGELQDAANFRSNGQCPKNAAPFINDSFPEPNLRKSKNGLLSVRLRAQMARAEINGQRYLTPSYNAQVPGPILVACPRDLLRINLRNSFDEADFEGEHAGDTNVHTHGFHVSPRRPQDNIFVIRRPGQKFQYQYKLPGDHPPGAYWYHPHVHGQTNPQTYGGMAGGIIIRGGLDVQKGYRNIGTRNLVIQQTTLNDDGTTEQPGPNGPFIPHGPNGEAPTFLVNGEINPRIPIKPGELQRWRIFNATAGTFVKLGLEGQPMRLLATDGNNLKHRKSTDDLTISPSSRREILVQGGPTGEAELAALPFQQFGPGSRTERKVLATLDSRGNRVHGQMPPRKLNEQQPDLRDRKVGSHHEIVYTQELGSEPKFFINGEQFSGPQDVMEQLDKDEVSEWTITNNTPFWHTFHIHINDFQVTERNGKPVHAERKDDNLAIAPGDSITMRYLPVKYTGKFVFHCHVLAHEDNGMMGVVRVHK